MFNNIECVSVLLRCITTNSPVSRLSATRTSLEVITAAHLGSALWASLFSAGARLVGNGGRGCLCVSHKQERHKTRLAYFITFKESLTIYQKLRVTFGFSSLKRDFYNEVNKKRIELCDFMAQWLKYLKIYAKNQT